MARATLSNLVDDHPSILLLLTVLAASIPSSHALNIWPRASDTCPSSYEKCGSSNLPSNFCCPQSSTCISLDDDSSAICCPKGQDCSYIKPVTCNVLLQDPLQFPKNPLMTTRLDDKLPVCGDSCCPFGYTCKSGTCVLNNRTAATATSIVSSATMSGISTESLTATASTTLSSETETATETTSTATTTPITPLDINASSSPLASSKDTCPSFPSKAVVAGFFPGMILGAALAFLALFCIRKRQGRKYSASAKTSHYTQHSSNGAAIHISSPIPSDESAYRTDFLLRSGTGDGNGRRNSDSAKSVLQRTGTRVKSLFASTPRLNGSGNSNEKGATAGGSSVPVPPLPVTPPRQIIPSRQPSTESIRVYSPAGGLSVGGATLRPVPYPSATRGRDRDRARPDTTFSEMIDRVGFQDRRGEPCFRVMDTPRPGPGRSPFRGERSH
ncbi:hypothetical protein PHISCL_06318 [Aspergillus sclerotialis]|uniref:GPI transamidase component PIG-S n=1 Tax=Aspergillus sclerotialis TaxID=2070753 RepID=A0A3A2ZGE1_9EURO|nr:hypothetical protein PHISCL_06318 [Aspergillus sclerotialis]